MVVPVRLHQEQSGRHQKEPGNKGRREKVVRMGVTPPQDDKPEPRRQDRGREGEPAPHIDQAFARG
jgi:hypothetical protein